MEKFSIFTFFFVFHDELLEMKCFFFKFVLNGLLLLLLLLGFY